MIWLCRYNITNNINYFDLLGTIIYALKKEKFLQNRNFISINYYLINEDAK